MTIKSKKSPEEKAFAKEVGEKLRRMRRHRGWSQTELANRVGVRFQQIQKYEYGKDSLSLWRSYNLARAFEMDHFVFIKLTCNDPFIQAPANKWFEARKDV